MAGRSLLRKLSSGAGLGEWSDKILGPEPPPVDLAEADQLNALHDRLLGLCCRHGALQERRVRALSPGRYRTHRGRAAAVSFDPRAREPALGSIQAGLVMFPITAFN